MDGLVAVPQRQAAKAHGSSRVRAGSIHRARSWLWLMFTVAAMLSVALAGLPRVAILPAASAVAAIAVALTGALRWSRSPKALCLGAGAAAALSLVASLSGWASGAKVAAWLLVEIIMLFLLVRVAR